MKILFRFCSFGENSTHRRTNRFVCAMDTANPTTGNALIAGYKILFPHSTDQTSVKIAGLAYVDPSKLLEATRALEEDSSFVADKGDDPEKYQYFVAITNWGWILEKKYVTTGNISSRNKYCTYSQ